MLTTQRIILTIFSIVIIIIFFQFEGNKFWINERVLAPMSEIENQLTHTEIEERMTMRFSNGYFSSKSIADFISKDTSKNKLILLPPKDYLLKNRIDYPVPEPIVFYYFTGMKSIWANEKGAEQSGFAVVVDNNRKLVIQKLDSTSRTAILKEFRTYKISL